ncbi:GntR family transcriptional regulator [Paenibacillus mucilaginosus]|uniref:Transcriptional regulator, GntR family with LacI sensor n=1 Tax=Paenibacillus mucilaginosus (strain KNP414) TaxID=1036673 RepID=F8F6F0_PAEMK|nr:GntR family transcriptional regulator [Paenibacillus mucilaginosus]AEI42904.1 transcriptional regulator, GntR family with LacI sensor [Paenibacillus mucilaginosus KNP414]MCG7216023.1 GntR family transcriptional regulator [Paenibacillus mucilaginosus]WDM31067.1 GntR family transcriptional regulator [Paenibacillus mucilaginosus]
MKNAHASKKPNLLYQQIADKVRGIIQSRRLQPHDPVPSEGELAKLFGVSRMTSKLALELLAEQGLVYRLPRRGTFLSGQQEGTPSNDKMPLEREPDSVRAEEQPCKQIALIVPHLSDYTSKIIAAAENEVRKYDCDLILKISKDKEDEDVCLQRLVEGGIGGIILFPQGRKTCSDQVLRLKLQQFPIVIIDRIFREVSIDCVYHDHYQGSYEMTKYLIGKGHREIGYTSNPVNHITSREERYQGYIQALLDHAIPVKTQYIHFKNVDCDPSRMNESDPEQERLIRANPQMTALLCGDDYVAISTLYTALRMEVAVPDQLSIVGFSDIHLSALTPIPLTTVRQDTEQLAQSAFHLLMKRVHHSMEKPITIKVQTTIVERKSVLQCASS